MVRVRRRCPAKKLIEAARWWAQGGRDTTGLASDLAAFGAPSADIQPLMDSADDGATEFEVWAENWDAICLFCRCATQWRWVVGHAAALRTGLDYSAVAVVMRSMRIPPARRDTLLQQVQTMEQEALRVWH